MAYEILPNLSDPFAPAPGDDVDLPASGPEVRDPPPSGPPG